MELYLILIVYLIVLICLIIIFYKSGIKLFSSVVVSIIICMVLLNILKPPNSIKLEIEDKSTYAFYILIQLSTLIIVFIYAVVMGLKDKYIMKHCYLIDNNEPFINIPKIF